MEHQFRYIQWRFGHGKKHIQQVAEAVRHWEKRFELGSAVLLCDDPLETVKAARKQWRKLTIQTQNIRNEQVSAERMLAWTRTVSRMQRVRFSSKDPAADTGATFYVLSPSSIKSLPINCFTIYMLTRSFS